MYLLEPNLRLAEDKRCLNTRLGFRTFGSTQATVSEKRTKSDQFFQILKVYKIMEEIVKFYIIDSRTVQQNVPKMSYP